MPLHLKHIVILFLEKESKPFLLRNLTCPDPFLKGVISIKHINLWFPLLNSTTSEQMAAFLMAPDSIYKGS